MNIKTLGSIGLLAVLSLVPAFGQLATLTGTTLSVAAAITDDTVTLASATGVTLPALGVAPSTLFVVSPGAKGEAMSVKSLVSGTTYRVSRGIQGTARTAQTSGALVLLGAPNNHRPDRRMRDRDDLGHSFREYLERAPVALLHCHIDLGTWIWEYLPASAGNHRGRFCRGRGCALRPALPYDRHGGRHGLYAASGHRERRLVLRAV
jgi:hypothetical protein